MHQQHLPGYTIAFRNAPWETRDSAHYRFYYFKNSLAEQEIENIISVQEDAYAKITSFLALPSYPDKKIFYYLYPDAETKKRLVGSSWFAQSVYEDSAVHALYTEHDRVIGPHEDTHLLSLPFGLSIGFLQEGLAEYMVGHDWYGNDFRSVVREALADESFIVSGDLLISHAAWSDTSDDYARQYYALAALFTEYVIERFGKERYFALYRGLRRDFSNEENGNVYAHVLNDSAQNLFREYLC